MTKRLLLTGASGFLGWNVIQAAGKGWQISGVVHKHTQALPIADVTATDLKDERRLKDTMRAIEPDAIIHTAAISDANYCEQHEEETELLNVRASVLLAEITAQLDIPFVFTSTDLVFDGQKGDYLETDTTNPLSAYGRQKLAAEQQILEAYPKACICRMPLMFGQPGPHAKSFIQPFLENLRSGKEIRLFTDEYRTAVDGLSAAQGLLLAAEQRWQGTWHLGGPQRLSRYEFGQLLTEVLDVPARNMLAVRQADVQMAAARPPDVSLNSAKAYAAGYQPMTNREALQSLKGII